MAYSVYGIPRKRGRSYIEETDRSLAERLWNLRESLLEKSELAKHAYEEGQRWAGMKPEFWKMKATAGI